MTKRIKTPRPGQQIRAKELERMARMVQNHEKRLLLTGIGHGMEGHDLSSAGLSWRNNRYIPFWAKITGNNPAAATVVAPPGIDAVSTTLPVASYANFPTAGYFMIVVDSEQMEVRGGWGTTSWTVARSQAGTVAVAHNPGAPVTGHKFHYTYTEQAQNMPSDWIDSTYPRLGTVNRYPAFEVNENEKVPDDTIVLMWLGYDGLIGSYYLFEYCCDCECGRVPTVRPTGLKEGHIWVEDCTLHWYCGGQVKEAVDKKTYEGATDNLSGWFAALIRSLMNMGIDQLTPSEMISLASTSPYSFSQVSPGIER